MVKLKSASETEVCVLIEELANCFRAGEVTYRVTKEYTIGRVVVR